MSSENEGSRPAAGSVVELMAASRSDTLIGWSEGRQADDLVVSAPLDRSQRPVSLGIGEHVELVWQTSGELRALPVVLVAVDSGERPRWRLRVAGVLRRGQRRDAVRAPLTVPVHVGPELAAVAGTTVDVSEGGLRCILDGKRQPSPSMAVGDVARVAVTFPELTITCLSEVTRQHAREDALVELSLRFIGLTENQEDLIRRRVFARLRELRHRGLL
jgi:PilZ domain